MKKCYECRKECEDQTKVFCDECNEKRDKGELQVKSLANLVIYDKI